MHMPCVIPGKVYALGEQSSVRENSINLLTWKITKPCPEDALLFY